MKKITLLLAILPAFAFAEIQPEPLGVVRSLPEVYPANWMIIQDSAFFHMSDGKFIVLDIASDDAASRFKGMFNGSAIAQFHQAKTKPEMYVVETFLSRGNRGERTDVLTIYDKRTLLPVQEVVVPAKRMSGMPTDYYLQLVDDEKLALVANFTPATSVSVIDIVERKFLGEIPIPGCSLVYPMTGRGFASLCADGSIFSVQIDADGRQASSSRTSKFFDADNDPLMEKAAMIDGVAYFPSFLGSVYPVDMNGPEPRVQEQWSLIGDGDDGWRPGGLALTGSDSGGHLYVLMHRDGYDGSHKDPGVEVWVFDTRAKRRIRRIALDVPAISIGLTRGDDPLLAVTNINLELDVYDSNSGEHQRTIGNFGQETPFLLHGAR